MNAAVRLAVGFLLVASHGCGTPLERGPSDGTLRVWKASHGETSLDHERVLAPFFAARPSLRLEALVHPWEGWDERYATAYTGGIAPDIAYMPDEFWPRFAAAGKLAALDELFPDEIAAMAREYPPNLWKLGSLNGHQYGIPYIYVSWHLFYNRDLFDRAGLPHPPATPQAPGFDDWTWERFREAGMALTQDRDGDGVLDQWGLAWTALDENPNTFYPFLWQGGADLLDADRRRNGFARHGRVGFTFIRDLARSGVLPEGGLFPGVTRLFYDGRAGMLIAPGSTMRVLKRDFPDLPFGAAIVPQGPATDFYEGRGAFGNTGFWVLSGDTSHLREAFDLLRYITAPEASAAMVEMMRLFSARRDWQAPDDDPRVQTFVAGRRFLVPYPLHPRLRLIHSIIQAEVQAMLLDRKTPEQAVAAAAAAVDDLVSLR
ncbi:ABC transporter substrate-binding protein [Candidatus Latescibacterota bacterium]